MKAFAAACLTAVSMAAPDFTIQAGEKGKSLARTNKKIANFAITQDFGDVTQDTMNFGLSYELVVEAAAAFEVSAY